MLRSSTRFFVLAATVALAACEDSTSPSAEDRAINLAVAQASGQVVANDIAVNPTLSAAATGLTPFLSTAGDPVATFDQTGPGSGPRAPSGCSMLAGPFPKFNCGRGRRGPGDRLGDRSFDRTVTYYNAAGTAQTGYDAVTTARIVFEVADTGTFSRGRGGNSLTDSSARSRRAELSGLAGDPDTLHIWNAVASGYQRSVRGGQGGTRSTEMTSSDTTTNLRYRLPRSANPWPLTGITVRNVTVTRVRTPTDSAATTTTRTRRVVIEYNGTGTAKMTVNGEVFDLDLETGEVTARNG